MRDPRERRRSVRRVGAMATLEVTTAMLVVVNAHALWRPWLGGVVTADWPHVLWAMDLSLCAQIAGAMMLIATGSRWLRRVAEAVNTFLGLLSLLVIWQVWPFELSLLAPGLDMTARLLGLLVLAALSIALVVNTVRVFVPPWHDPSSHHGAA